MTTKLMKIDPLSELRRRKAKFEAQAKKILSTHDSSTARVHTVVEIRDALTNVSSQQGILLNEAIGCAEHGFYRSAHVCAWAAFMDHLQICLTQSKLHKLQEARPKWSICSVDDLREKYPEAQVIDVACEVSVFRKSEVKILHGLLARRNECAHPNNYMPGINETLGYISEVLKMMGRVSQN